MSARRVDIMSCMCSEAHCSYIDRPAVFSAGGIGKDTHVAASESAEGGRADRINRVEGTKARKQS